MKRAAVQTQDAPRTRFVENQCKVPSTGESRKPPVRGWFWAFPKVRDPRWNGLLIRSPRDQVPPPEPRQFVSIGVRLGEAKDTDCEASCAPHVPTAPCSGPKSREWSSLMTRDVMAPRANDDQPGRDGPIAGRTVTAVPIPRPYRERVGWKGKQREPSRGENLVRAGISRIFPGQWARRFS